MDTSAMARDLNAKNVVVIGPKNGDNKDLIVTYLNEFKGKNYFHIRTVYQNDRGKWAPGKGISVDPANAKNILTQLGQAAVAF